MKINGSIRLLPKLVSLWVLLFVHTFLLAQEKEIRIEESAAVSLEEYSDTFQEQFFEGLKQKGIENYDKAINHFLKCKGIDEKSPVVSHELAKAYLLDKQFINAQTYALEALNSEPENLWYLYTLNSALQQQGSSISTVTKNIPYSNTTLRENLSRIYYKQKNYRGALSVLEGVKKMDKQKDLFSKIEDAIAKQDAERTSVSYSATNTASRGSVTRDGNVQSYKARIKGLIFIKAYGTIKQVAAEAIEQYPLQPYFYYAQGFALNQTKNHRGALEVLEISLDYLLDDISISNKIYKEMANAYTGLNQTSRANMYLRKIKPGF